MAAWLRCRLDSGMFSDEVAVTYPPDEELWQKSVFVPESCVRREDNHHGVVKVRVLIQDGVRFAELPSPQRDIVKFQDADLRQFV